LGNALVGMKRPEGVAALERAISIKPDYVPPYTSLAWYYLGVGDLRGAEATARRLRQRDILQADRLEKVIDFTRSTRPR
ncbi:MAG TPA: tetratricopeptide repeat protein, partial [bacterium]